MSDAAESGRSAGVRRTVIVGDGIAWLRASTLTPTQAIVTSLPDASELRPIEFDAWRSWFVDTAELVCRTVAPDAVAVFYQTDVRRAGRWIDKGHLVTLGAERAGAACVHHKIVCRAPAGTPVRGRPGYAHLLAFSKGSTIQPDAVGADVLPALGEMSWSRAMGTAACEDVCRFLLRSTTCRTVVDPFCGQGTMLAVASAYGLDAIGVELNARRASRARSLTFRIGHGLA